jgi:ABC-type antimicrobial peptide transport system permease subunit
MFPVARPQSTGPLSFGALAIVMLLTGLLSAWGLAPRAIRVDPKVALGYE